MIAGIANEVFKEREHKEYWIALLGVESGFDNRAKSHAGAVGIGQLMPAYRADFGKGCGITEVDKEDLQDTYTNAYLSACYFRTLIEETGSIPLASCAYNAGLNSTDLKRAMSGIAPGQEPSAYVTKIWIAKERQEDD